MTVDGDFDCGLMWGYVRVFRYGKIYGSGFIENGNYQF